MASEPKEKDEIFDKKKDNESNDNKSDPYESDHYESENDEDSYLNFLVETKINSSEKKISKQKKLMKKTEYNSKNINVQRSFFNKLYTRNNVGTPFLSGKELYTELKILISMTLKNIDFRRKYKTYLPENGSDSVSNFKIREVNKTTGISPENEQLTLFCLNIYILFNGLNTKKINENENELLKIFNNIPQNNRKNILSYTQKSDIKLLEKDFSKFPYGELQKYLHLIYAAGKLIYDKKNSNNFVNQNTK